MKKMHRLFSLLLVLAMLASMIPSVFATESTEPAADVATKADVDTDEIIVGDWLWGSVMDARGADVIMKEYAETGFTDLYLLVKGLGGTCSWNSSVPGAAGTNSYSYDLLQRAIDAAKPYGIRIHAWMMAAVDNTYMKTHANENYYHFRVGYSNEVNQCVNLRGTNYRNYFAALVQELSTKYPDLAGIHLDTIRYNGIWYDWGLDARTELINNYGMTKAEWNAAVKALCVSAGFVYTTNSEGYYVFSAKGTTSGTSLASALTSSADNDTTRGVKKVYQMRLDTVNNFIKHVKENVRDDMIITTAIMPDTSIDGAYAQFEYGQQPKTMVPHLDYICTMSYASTYQCAETWPATLSKAITDVGGNVVAAIQYFDNESTSGGPTNTRIYNEINKVMEARETVNNDNNDATGKILGYAIFRNGFGVYGGAKIEDESNMTIYAHNQLSSAITKLIIKAKGNVTFNSVSNKNGWSGCTFTISSDKKTLTITGSSLLKSKGNSSFTLNYSGTFTDATGACMMDAYTASGAVYTVCNTYGTTCKHEYSKTGTAPTCTAAGSYTYTCGLCGDTYTETPAALGHSYSVSFDEATLTSTYTCTICGDEYTVSCKDGHTRVETWAETETTHFMFCYTCNTAKSETCHWVEKDRKDATCTEAGYVVYVCGGTEGACDAYSGMGCGNSYTEVLEAGHAYGEYTHDADNHYMTCALCGETVTEAHTVVVDPAVEGDCTTDGKTEGKSCSVCEAVLVEATTIPAPGHKEVTVPGKPASCTEDGLTEGKVCGTCGEVLVAQTVIAGGSHNNEYIYEDEDCHIVECTVCFYSYTEEHTYVDGVCVCGATITTPEVPSGPIVDENIKIAHSLNLTSDISINFAVNANLLANYDSFYLSYTVPKYQGNTIAEYNEGIIEGVYNKSNGYYYFIFKGMNALRMNDMVEATLHMFKDGKEYVSNVDKYSVGTYAYNKLKDATASSTLKRMCADLLQYGAAAQIYKNYHTDALVNADMTAEQKAYLTDLETVTFGTVSTKMGDVANAPISWYSKTLVVDSTVAIRFYFDATNYNGDIENLKLVGTFTNVNGKTETVEITECEVYNASKNLYSFTFDGLLAAELRTVVEFAIYEGNTQLTETWFVQPDQYANGKTGTLLDICRALFAYSDSAKNYLANPNG